MKEELAAYEAGETFVQFLIVQIDGLLNSFKNSLSPRNYDALVSILASEVTTRLERAIKKSTFNRVSKNYENIRIYYVLCRNLENSYEYVVLSIRVRSEYWLRQLWYFSLSAYSIFCVSEFPETFHFSLWMKTDFSGIDH